MSLWTTNIFIILYVGGVQLLSHVPLFATPWTAACQASLSLIISWSLLKLMSIESVMPSNHLILYSPLLLLPSIFPSIRVFSNGLVLCMNGQSIGVSASALPMNIQGWFPLGLIDLISLFSKRLHQQYSSKASILWHSAFLLFASHICTWLLEKS